MDDKIRTSDCCLCGVYPIHWNEMSRGHCVCSILINCTLIVSGLRAQALIRWHGFRVFTFVGRCRRNKLWQTCTRSHRAECVCACLCCVCMANLFYGLPFARLPVCPFAIQICAHLKWAKRKRNINRMMNALPAHNIRRTGTRLALIARKPYGKCWITDAISFISND